MIWNSGSEATAPQHSVRVAWPNAGGQPGRRCVPQGGPGRRSIRRNLQRLPRFATGSAERTTGQSLSGPGVRHEPSQAQVPVMSATVGTRVSRPGLPGLVFMTVTSLPDVASPSKGQNLLCRLQSATERGRVPLQCVVASQSGVGQRGELPSAMVDPSSPEARVSSLVAGMRWLTREAVRRRGHRPATPERHRGTMRAAQEGCRSGFALLADWDIDILQKRV